MKTKISARKFLSKYMIYLAFVALLIVFFPDAPQCRQRLSGYGQRLEHHPADSAHRHSRRRHDLCPRRRPDRPVRRLRRRPDIPCDGLDRAGRRPHPRRAGRSGRRRCRRRDQRGAHRMGKNPALYRYARHADPLCRCFAHGLRSEIRPHHEHDVQLCVRRRRLRRRSCAASLDGS